MSKILLVDDEKDITITMQSGLIKSGFEVDSFNNPKEALLRFTPNTYDLILLDVRMPLMSGFELYDKLKKIDPDAKIHFITAFDFFGAAPKHIISDMVGKNFIQKPVRLDQMIELISMYIGNNPQPIR